MDAAHLESRELPAIQLLTLDVGLTTDASGLGKIRDALMKLGFEFSAKKGSQSDLKMSTTLKESILWIAENRGKPWNTEQLDE